jgi:DNA-binding GntR family transcriptional regulator
MSALDFPIPFEQDRTRHAAIQVFEHLRSMIISLALKPGTVLPRQDLAQYYDLSLTPIRDALLQLEKEGLVDIFPQSATVVRQIDVASARQAHFLRLSMELEIAHTLASSPPPALVRSLNDTIGLQRTAYEQQDFDRFSLADLDFHRLMYRAVGIENLWGLMRSASGNLDRLRRLHVPIPGKAESILRGHGEIVAAIDARDPGLAQQCVRRHLSGTLAHLDDIRAQYPEYLFDPAPAVAG